ncbi:MAG: hypothetical protein OHK0040_06440 [bacterium]
MKKVMMVFCFFILLSGISFAEDEKTREITLEPGYKVYSVDKSPSLADEYSHSKSSPSIKFSIKDYSENNKYNIMLNINEYDDYDFDIHWYYKDRVRAELTGVYFDHDLGFKSNTALVNLTPDADFIVKYRNQKAELKYKPFLYPFHIRLNAEKIEREGDVQKRFLGTASSNPAYNSYDSIFSLKTPVNAVTNVGGISLDGLVGGINVFLEATRTTYNDDAKKSDDGILNAPEISEGTYSLKLTSNQSGKISYALSFSRRDRDNDSRDEAGRKGASSSYNNTSFILSYYPLQHLKLSLRAAYEDYDQDNTAQWRYIGSDYAVQQPITYIRKTISAKGRYDFSRTTYIAVEVKERELDRDNTLNEVPENSRQFYTKTELGTALRDKLSIKLAQQFEKNNNPAYKDVPESLSKTSINGEYTITDKAGLDFNIFYLYETNNNITSYFVENRTKGVNATFYYNYDDKLSMNLYGLLESQDYKSDLEFGKPTSPGHFVIRTPYEAKTMQLGVNTNKKLSLKQELYVDVFYLRGYGTYTPQNVSGVIGTYAYDTTGLERLAQVDFYQYGLLLGTKYKVSSKDNVKCEIGYKDHEEKSDTALSGTVKTLFLAWERKW